jgi:hypothetical protein
MNDIESRLRQFRPRRPAAIPDERLQLLRGPIWMAVAAGMAALMLIATWMQRPPQPQQVRPAASVTLGALTTIAVEHPEQLDAALTELSRTTLPDVTERGGALELLAKEF